MPPLVVLQRARPSRAASTGMATSRSLGKERQETNVRCAAHHTEGCGVSISVLGDSALAVFSNPEMSLNDGRRT
jgi:hypothetical protein